jgi:hypothetical protein
LSEVNPVGGGMIDFDESELSAPKLISLHASIFLLAIYFLSAGLDVADSFLAIADPEPVTKFACAIRPLAIVPVPNLSKLSPYWLADQCLGGLREPAISMIFFSVKLTMALVAFFVLWGFLFWSPKEFWLLKDFYWQRFRAPGGYRKELKSFSGTSIGIIAFLTCCLLLASVSASDPKAGFILASKFVVEDGLAIAIPGMMFDAVVRAFLFISFAWLYRNQN